ncbi:DNA-binding transcriptional LysR family regulator [Methylobacterium sp. BE186]|uniref:LysR family transcriptional regulator n=1 Tax=Methylobacterium sp. BE186 TaxID=2817715 RepID=UPI002865C830|nr:LysR family transcriptional regulator [Methylobacterium sp. BE186]MDR7040482.1 DNA-binding transcriptional LysR family regulator [Methylobacterium sp. BE186]
MSRPPLADLGAFIAVARERSFTRAAAQLGVSPSALSQTIRSLEERLGVRLLTRTTRRVAPTDAGERLIATVAPHLEGIENGLAALSELRDKPAGTIRITAVDHAAETILWPALADFLAEYPAIHVELIVDNTLRDIVVERFDAGIRMGERVARDMIAVRIGPEIRMAAVATPAYFEKHGRPKVPQDLATHSCINLRMPTLGGVYAWEFEKGSREINVRVEGQLTTNDIAVIKTAALNGLGLAFMPEDVAQPHLDTGDLVRVLADWTPPFPGYHLYYPSRRQQSPAFALLVEALRYRGS